MPDDLSEFAGKHAHDALFNPQDFIDSIQPQQSLSVRQLAQSIMFCYLQRKAQGKKGSVMTHGL
jgi:hypothetical protein